MIKVIKDHSEKMIHEHKLNEYLQAGWSTQSAGTIKAVDEIVRLKPPVKTKATVRALDEAKDYKGDE